MDSMKQFLIFAFFIIACVFVYLFIFSPNFITQIESVDSKANLGIKKKLDSNPRRGESLKIKNSSLKETTTLDQDLEKTEERLINLISDEVFNKRDQVASKSFNKTYIKVHSFEISSNSVSDYKIKFNKEVKGVLSVVLVLKEGVVSPTSLSVNKGEFRKDFLKGQDLFKEDWVKLEVGSNRIKTIELKLKGQEELNFLEVYVQKLNK